MTINAVNVTMRATSGGPLVNLDNMPDLFNFIDQTDVPLSTIIESAPITVEGVDEFAAPVITITGGEYSINLAAYTSSPGNTALDDSIKVRHTSSGSNSTPTNTILTIGGVSDTFTSVTLASGGGQTITDSGGTVLDGENFSIFISGGGLTNVTFVTINGINCTNIVVVDDFNITATAPSDDLLHGVVYTMVLT